MSEDHFSPDGQYNLLLGMIEMRMSHTVQNPGLYDVKSGAVLFDTPSLWSAGAIEWSPDSTFVYLNMLMYPGSKPGISLWLYPAISEGKVQIDQPADAKEPARIITGSFAEILRFLNTY